MNSLNYEKRAVQEGARARNEGGISNPYVYGTQSQRRWDRGFRKQGTCNILPDTPEVTPEVKASAKSAPKSEPKPKTTAKSRRTVAKKKD